MKETKTVLVDGIEYQVSPYLSSKGLKLLVELFNLIGEEAIQFAMKMGEDKKAGKTSVGFEDELSKIIRNLTTKTNPDLVEALIKKILLNTYAGTSRSVVEDFDLRFQGKYGHLFKLVAKTLGAQYGDFLGALGGLAS
jgi:hypothetical protein